MLLKRTASMLRAWRQAFSRRSRVNRSARRRTPRQERKACWAWVRAPSAPAPTPQESDASNPIHGPLGDLDSQPLNGHPH